MLQLAQQVQGVGMIITITDQNGASFVFEITEGAVYVRTGWTTYHLSWDDARQLRRFLENLG
jgi:hypothetical protein